MSYLGHFLMMCRQLRWPAEKIRREQDRLLSETVRHAYEHVAFYRRSFDAAGLNPQTIRGLEDLRRIPITRRIAYRSTPEPDRLARGADLARCITSATSGSTGIPVKIFKSPAERAMVRSGWLLARMRHGLWPWQSRLSAGVIRKLSPAPWHKVVGMDKACEVALRQKPCFIDGYPTQLLILAQEIRTRGITSIRPKALNTGGETLTPATRRFIEETFRAPLYDFFGTHEFGIIFEPCPAGRGFRQLGCDWAVEVLQPDGQPAAPGEQGELVVTALRARVMPFIRYALADVAVAGDPKCPCGSAYLHVAKILGRETAMVITPDGRQVSPMMVAKPFMLRDDVLHYRVTQQTRDSMFVEVVLGSTENADELERSVREQYQRLFGTCTVRFARVPSIPADANGKLRRFIPLPEATP